MDDLVQQTVHRTKTNPRTRQPFDPRIRVHTAVFGILCASRLLRAQDGGGLILVNHPGTRMGHFDGKTLDGWTVRRLPTQCYFARKLRFGDQAHEGIEQVRCVTMTPAEAVQKVINSEITHGPSCAVILKAAMNAF
jgi:hypothetical protein